MSSLKGMNKINENNSEFGFKVKKNKNKFKFNMKYTEIDDNFLCKGCDYRSDCLARMKAHLVCHSGSRPYKCKYEGCGQAFKRNNSLKRHVSAIHLNERLYSCNICEKKFSQCQSLNDHIFIHLEKKSFKCLLEDCNKSFQTPKSLKAHQNRRHLNRILRMNSDKTYKHNERVETMKSKAIQELNAMLAQKSGLTTNTNINNVSAYKLFKCTVVGCGHSFQLQRSLRSHYKYSHSKQYNKTTKSEDMSTTDVESNDSNDDFNDDSNESSVVVKVEDKNSNVSQRVSKMSDTYIMEKISQNSFVFECNFDNCFYKTKLFLNIAEHFATHWQQMPLSDNH